jgi:hypothetical protein
MLFGHNTNISLDGITYHVQTEDRGANHAVIDTTVHCRGRVMHRRTKTYADLLPLDAEREQALRARLDGQHWAVVDEMRSGTLQLPPPPPEPPRRSAVLATDATGVPNAPGAAAQPTAPTHLKLELLNARTWLHGRNAALQILVRDASSNVVSGARVSVRVDNASGPVEFLASSNEGGRADLEFEMPRLATGEVTLVIQASRGTAEGQLRFALRAKPRIPSAN